MIKKSTPTETSWPKLGHGIGLRSQHWSDIVDTMPTEIDFFEIVSENFMLTEGKSWKVLETLRKNYPFACHGVSLNIGSCDPVNQDYLKELKKLIDRLEPAIVSDHLCWTGVDGVNSHDLLPLPQNQETLQHVVNKLDQVQNFLGRKILLENASTYVAFDQSDMPEWDFINEIASSSGCGILLDLNNIFVNSHNHGFNPNEYIASIDPRYVGQYHLAGHIQRGDYLFDTHSKPVKDEVWDLYRMACRSFDHVSTLIEWDADIPELETLLNQSRYARKTEYEQSQHAA